MFVGPEALGVVPGSWVPERIDHRAEWAAWEVEMSEPGTREACAAARAECVRIVREATRASLAIRGTFGG
ncbi:MAG: hypothetical protein IMZ55_06285 [Acidobacteria bacterium]|nr:hypothetical protein [Acidobacteriota bacterium]